MHYASYVIFGIQVIKHTYRQRLIIHRVIKIVSIQLKEFDMGANKYKNEKYNYMRGSTKY